jgi:hypothetical protein
MKSNHKTREGREIIHICKDRNEGRQNIVEILFRIQEMQLRIQLWGKKNVYMFSYRTKYFSNMQTIMKTAIS